MEKEIKKSEGVDNQIIIYAKHWYKSSKKGAVEDVRLLLEKWCEHDVPEVDAKEMIVRCFAQYVSGSHMEEALVHVMGIKNWPFNGYDVDPYEIMIGKLAIIDGGFVDMSKKIPDFCLKEEEVEAPAN